MLVKQVWRDVYFCPPFAFSSFPESEQDAEFMWRLKATQYLAESLLGNVSIFGFEPLVEGSAYNMPQLQSDRFGFRRGTRQRLSHPFNRCLVGQSRKKIFQYKKEKENPTLITCGIMSSALRACLKAIWHIQRDMSSYLSSLF